MLGLLSLLVACGGGGGGGGGGGAEESSAAPTPDPGCTDRYTEWQVLIQR